MKKAKQSVVGTFHDDWQTRAIYSKLAEIGVREKNVVAFPCKVSSIKAEDDLAPSSLYVTALSSITSGAVGAGMGFLTAIGGLLPSTGSDGLSAVSIAFMLVTGLVLGATIGGLSGWYQAIGHCKSPLAPLTQDLDHEHAKIFIVATADSIKAEEIKHIYEESGAEDISMAEKKKAGQDNLVNLFQT